jgi:hypothetical protein
MAQRWHGLLLLLARSTQQGRAGQGRAGAGNRSAGSTAGKPSTSGKGLCEQVFVYNDLITFKKNP